MTLTKVSYPNFKLQIFYIQTLILFKKLNFKKLNSDIIKIFNMVKGLETVATVATKI